MEKKEKKKKSESEAKGGIHKNGGRKKGREERDGGRGGKEQKIEQRQPASTNQGKLQSIIPHSLICTRRVFLHSN